METSPKKTILFFVNVDWFFLSHRLPIAIEALNQGYEVHVATSITDKWDELRSYGFIVHPVKMERSGTNIAREIKTFFDILQIFNKVQPHIVHLVTIKPVLLGGIAARLTGVPAVVAAISGLGFVFLAKGRKALIIRYIVTALYRLALGKRNLKIICQNPDDQETISQVAGLPPGKTTLIPGSGIDLSVYTQKPIPQGDAVVIMAARLLKDKGVYEFVDAARLLKQRGINAQFWLAGEPDAGNPNSIKETEIIAWRDEKILEPLGYREDIANLFSQSSIVVLPSYREGLPKVLIEAAACARAIVTTDVPGCRDSIEPGKSGLLVPVKNSTALADAIQHLIDNPQLCRSMGQAGRALAERKFAIEKIIHKHLKIYEALQANE